MTEDAKNINISDKEAIEKLIEIAHECFDKMSDLEKQGHKPLKDALLICFSIAQKINDDSLETLLIEENLIKLGKYDEKNKAKYILWLTMGKPKSKNKSDDDKKVYKQQSARLRMYVRVLKKFMSLNLEEQEAENFLETYGVYAIANLKKVEDFYSNKSAKDDYEKTDTDEDNVDEEDEDDEEDDDDEDEDDDSAEYEEEEYDDGDDSSNDTGYDIFINSSNYDDINDLLLKFKETIITNKKKYLT